MPALRTRSRAAARLLAGILAALLPACGALASSGSAPAGHVQIVVLPGAGRGPVVSLIRSARHSIRLETYLLTDRTIMAELARARRRGIDVRVLLEERPYGAERYATEAYSTLKQDGVPVRWANERSFTFTHEKAVEVDGHVAGIFTFNLSLSAFERNREFGVIDPSAADAGVVAQLFAADWSRVRPHIREGRLVVSPYNSRSVLEHVIDGARHRLDIYAEEVADSGIEIHLAAAVRRGVLVRLITSTASAGVQQIRASGVRVRIMASPYVHAKAIVSDVATLFVGSENLSSTSLDQNRELGIVLQDRSAAGVVERTFAGDWGGSGPTPPPPPTGGSLRVRVTADPPAVQRGQLLTVRAETRAGASCTIRVTYPDGYVSRARALSGSRLADSSGTVSWSWHVGSTATGTSRADVTCTLNGTSASGSASFQVR